MLLNTILQNMHLISLKPFLLNLSWYFTFPATPRTSIVAACAAINADAVDFICTSAFAIFGWHSSISVTKFCNSPSLIFISGTNRFFKHFTLYFTKSHSCSVFSFSHCALSIHYDNLFSTFVCTSPTCKCTKIWYEQSWHDVICANSIHMTYLCVASLIFFVFLYKCLWVCMWTVTCLSIIYTNAKYVKQKSISKQFLTLRYLH